MGEDVIVLKFGIIIGVSAVALALAAATSAGAAVVTVKVDANILTTPYTIDFGTGAVTFSTVNTGLFDPNPDGVQTTGTAQVFSVGAPFYSSNTPTSFFTNRGGAFGPGQNLGFFASYAKPTAIPYSLSEGLVGLGYTLKDGFHYAYADLAGSELYGYRYNTTPNQGIPFGAVPEPATWGLMFVGLFGAGAMLRATGRERRRDPRRAAVGLVST